MSCNKDEDCYRIYIKEYPSYLGTIDPAIRSIKTQIEEVETSLTGLSLPDDYLGNKIKDKLDILISDIDSDKSSISAETTAIRSHIITKRAEHKEHYEEWKIKKARLDEQKDNSSQTTEEV